MLYFLKAGFQGYQTRKSEWLNSQLYDGRPDQTRVVTAEFPVHFYFSWGLTAGSFVPATTGISLTLDGCSVSCAPAPKVYFRAPVPRVAAMLLTCTAPAFSPPPPPPLSYWPGH